MPHIQGISHLGLKVHDVDAAVKFYGEGLGLLLRQRTEGGANLLTPDNVTIEISAGGAYCEPPDGWGHFCLETYDTDAAFARALACGATPSRPENPVPYTYKNLRIAFVRTPTGEELEFFYIMRGGLEREGVIGGRYIRSFIHAAVSVPDLDASIAFYEALGARLKVHWEWGCSMKLPDNREIELFGGGVPMAPRERGITHLCFAVDDVDAVVEKALSLGGKLFSKPSNWTNLRFAYFLGRGDERIEVFQFFPEKNDADAPFNVFPSRLYDPFAE